MKHMKKAKQKREKIRYAVVRGWMYGRMAEGVRFYEGQDLDEGKPFYIIPANIARKMIKKCRGYV